MSDTKVVLIGFLIGFLLISLAPYIINGLVTIRDALINSGLLSGSVTSTTIKHITLDDIKANLTKHGLINTTDQRVIIKDSGNQYIVTVMRKSYSTLKLESRDKIVETWDIKQQFTIPKTKSITITSTYDFTDFVKIVTSIIAVMIVIVVAEKFGIKL